MANVKKNFALQSAYQILTIFTPLITAPYVSRVLGADNLGIYSYTESVAAYFVLFAMLGIDTYGNRSIAKVRDDPDTLNKVFSEIFFVHAVLSLVCAIGYFGYVFISGNSYLMYELIWGFYIVSALLDVNWFFYGLEEFKITVTRSFVVKLLSLVCIFLFVKTREDLAIYVMIISVSHFLSPALLWLRVFKYVHFERINCKCAFRHFKPMAVLFIAVIATSIYRMMDKVMLGSAGLTTQLGCYEYADKIIKIAVGLITALGTVMLPKMTNLYNNKEFRTAERYMRSSAEFVFFMCGALMFGMAAIADEFAVIFLGNEFQYTGVLIQTLALSILFMGWNNLIRTQYIIPLGKDKIYLIAVWAGAITNVVLNILLIPLLGAIGAGIATDAAYIAVVLFQTVPIRKEIPVLEYVTKCVFPIISGIVMYCSVRLVAKYVSISIIGLVVEILVGAGIYLMMDFAYLRKTGNPMLKSYIDKLKKILGGK